MIALFDDFLHIERACSKMINTPDDRIAVSALNCFLGESIDTTRWVSLLMIFITIFVLDRIYFNERNWRRLLLFFIHPLVLVPFFWASQITTSMSVLWSSIWVLLFLRWFKSTKPIVSRFLPVFLFTFVGFTLRFESVAYVFVLLSLWAIQNRKAFIDGYRKVIAGLVLISLLFARFVTGIIHYVVPYESPFNQVAVTASGNLTSYPQGSWIFLQMDAVWSYVEALVLPWKASFYGNWYRWWEILKEPSVTVMRFSFLIITGVVILSLSYFYFRKKKETTEIPVKVFWAFVFFLGVTIGLSALPRSDWYYLSRVYLGTLCFMVWMTPLLVRKKILYYPVAIILLVSSCAHGFLHYSSESNMRIYEKEVAGGAHPFLDFTQAAELDSEGKHLDAIKVLHGVYQKIPKESAMVSSRAGIFWSLALYHSWVIYEKMGEHQNAAEVFRHLRDSTYFPSIHACLQNDSEPVEKCLAGDLKTVFCTSFAGGFPNLETVRPYRVSVESVCGFKPPK